MRAKRALIVDDSKSARLFLSRILVQHAIEVETVESAEAAIEFLADHRPDVIFMDHQMPGMDGLQAVKAIKNNPITATIPIMMYTSQEGELYLGQARALGAVGVMPKQIRQADVSKVLYELRLLPERRNREHSGMRPVSLDALADAAADKASASGASTKSKRACCASSWASCGAPCSRASTLSPIASWRTSRRCTRDARGRREHAPPPRQPPLPWLVTADRADRGVHEHAAVVARERSAAGARALACRSYASTDATRAAGSTADARGDAARSAPRPAIRRAPSTRWPATSPW